jgi:hypothetical protein
MLAVAGWLPVRSVAAAGRQASSKLRENTPSPKLLQMSCGRGPGLGSKRGAGRHPRAPPEAADDASRPQSWCWNGSANCEACEAQAVASLADKFVLTVLLCGMEHDTPQFCVAEGRLGWDWGLAVSSGHPHCPAACISRAVSL